MKKLLSKQILDLKIQISDLKKKLAETEEDRRKFREYFSGKLKWFVELYGSQKVPSMDALIQDMVKFFQRVKWFYW